MKIKKKEKIAYRPVKVGGMTAAQLAKRYGRAITTMANWWYRDGLRTLEEFDARAKRSCGAPARRIDGMTFEEIGRKVGRAPSTISNWFYKENLKTFEAMKQRAAERRPVGGRAPTTVKTMFGLLTFEEMADIMVELYGEKRAVKRVAVRSRVVKYPNHEVAWWLEKCSNNDYTAHLLNHGVISSEEALQRVPEHVGLTEQKKKEEVTKICKNHNLKWGALCNRYGKNGIIEEICRHKRSCSDSRVFSGKNHPRYKEDGSCYEGVPTQCGTPTALRKFQINLIENYNCVKEN